jgi:hypothetical protein
MANDGEFQSVIITRQVKLKRTAVVSESL